MEEFCYKIFNNFLQVKNVKIYDFLKKYINYSFGQAKTPDFYRIERFLFFRKLTKTCTYGLSNSNS